MLTLIPRAPRRTAARAISAQLAASGYVISHRTVERDLRKLASVFAIGADESHRPFGWFWSGDAG